MKSLDAFIEDNGLRLSADEVRITVPEEAGAYRRFTKLLVFHLVVYWFLRFVRIPGLSCTAAPHLWSALGAVDMALANVELYVLEGAPDTAPTARLLATSVASLTLIDVVTPLQRYFAPDSQLLSCSFWFKILRLGAMALICTYSALWLLIYGSDEHVTSTQAAKPPTPASFWATLQKFCVSVTIIYVTIKICNFFI